MAYTEGPGLLPIQPMHKGKGLLPIQPLAGAAVVNIISTGVQNVSSAQLQVGSDVYSAPTTSVGIGPGQGLALFVQGSTITWMTADQQSFKNSIGAVLSATNGASYCVNNASNSATALGIGTNSGPISNMMIIQPGTNASFTMNVSATPTNAIVISPGCGTQLRSSENGSSNPSTSTSSTTKKVVIGISIALVVLVVLGLSFVAYKRVG